MIKESELNQMYSLNDLYEHDTEDLETKVVVLYSSPDNLDEEEAMNKTTFYQIKR